MRKITFLIALAAVATVSAAELHVPAQYPTIQGAIDAAASGDAVVVAPGTYRETFDLREKELTLRGSGGAAATMLDGSGGTTSILTARHVLPRNVVVQGFTFRNGPGSLLPSCGLDDVRKGGAILVSRARLTIVDCVFEDNSAEGIEYGGAIFSCETDLSVKRSDFTRNRANHGTIVIASAGPRASSITDSRFTNNTGDTDTAGVLAKLRSSASLTVRDCDFEDNEGGHGSAMMFELLDRSRAAVERVRFSRNHARGTAGGLDVLASDEAAIALSDCTFDGNRAAHGAGLQLVTERSAIASVAGCTFRGGTASFGGGANVVSAGAAARIELTDCAFTGNQASFGGGLVATALGGAIRISGSRFLDNVAERRPETGIYWDLCFIDGLPPQGNGLYFGGAADLRTQEAGSIIVSSSLFAGNSGMRAGGIHASTCAGGDIDLVNNTIVGNAGSGVHVRFGLSREPQYTNLGAIRIANAIVRENSAEEIVVERFDTRGDAAVSYSNVEGGFAGAGNFDLPPSFVDAAARDYRLAAGSACIDAGDNSALTTVIDDVDLARRPRRSGRSVDVGAYEYQWSAPRRRAARF